MCNNLVAMLSQQMESMCVYTRASSITRDKAGEMDVITNVHVLMLNLDSTDARTCVHHTAVFLHTAILNRKPESAVRNQCVSSTPKQEVSKVQDQSVVMELELNQQSIHHVWMLSLHVTCMARMYVSATEDGPLLTVGNTVTCALMDFHSQDQMIDVCILVNCTNREKHGIQAVIHNVLVKMLSMVTTDV